LESSGTDTRRRTMLETIAWVVMLLVMGGAIVVLVGVAIFMLSSDE
jgi:hypothetical protein